MGKPSRHLAAIWFADIVGYGSLLSENEELALRQVALFQDICRTEIDRRGGRLVHFVGDAVLAEFASTEAALRTALSVHSEFATASRRELESDGLLRSGVHLGEVTDGPNGVPYGEGVSAASRLQQAADPGQILVSVDVQRQLRTRPEWRFEPLGNRRLDGVAEPLEVYAVELVERDEGAGRRAGIGRAAARLPRDLVRRRVPQYTALYLGGSWGLVQFVAFLEARYMLSPHLTDLTWTLLALLLPAVVFEIYLRSDGGPNRLVLAEKVAIPANFVLAVAVLAFLFGGKDLGAVMTRVAVVDEEGRTEERLVPKYDFRKRIAIFPLDPAPGDTAAAWLSSGVPAGLLPKLRQNLFVEAHTNFRYDLERAGYADVTGVPLPLKQRIARERHLPFFTDGTVVVADGQYSVSLSLYETRRARLVAQHTASSDDPLAVVDELSARLKEDLGIPNWYIDEVRDLPARELLTASPDAFRLYAEARKGVISGDWQGAAPRLEEAVRFDPTFAYAHELRSRVFENLNQGDRAREAIGLAVAHRYRLPERDQFRVRDRYHYLHDEWERAMAVVEMRVELFPDDVEAHLARAEYQRHRGEWTAVIESYRRVLELEHSRSHLLHRIAYAYITLADFDAAETFLRRYADEFPDDFRSFMHLANLFSYKGDHEHAVAYFERALLLEPRQPWLLWRLAESERSLGRVDIAREHLEAALEASRTPEDRRWSLHHLRLHYRNVGRLVEALRYLELELAEAEKHDAPLNVLRARMHGAELHALAGDSRTAFELLRDVRERLTPPHDQEIVWGELNLFLALEDADGIERAAEAVERLLDARLMELCRCDLMHARGRGHDLRGRYSEAIAAYEEALRISPTRHAEHAWIGRARRELGELDLSQAAIARTLEFLPFDPQANYEMALTYRTLGRHEEALAHLNRTLAVWRDADPEFRPALLARERLVEWTAPATGTAAR